jgi:vacuolar-type H+-ATPase subunit E/Vma4
LELQGITGTILLEAKESAEIIINDAQEQAEKLIKQQKQLGTKEANTKRKSMLKKATNEVNMERLNKIANSKITSNWIVLSRKEEIISSVIKEAKKRLYELTKSKKYVSILEDLTIKAGIIIEDDKIEVLLNEEDSKMPLDFTKLAKKISSKTKTKVELSLSKEKIQVIGGVMLRTHDGRVIMDYTFDDLIKQKQKIIKNKISEILFK